MFRQAIQFKLTFVLILCMRLFLEVHAAERTLPQVTIHKKENYTDLRPSNTVDVKEGSVPNTVKENEFCEHSCKIVNIEERPLQNLTDAKHLDLRLSNTVDVKEGSVPTSVKENKFCVHSCKIVNIEERTLQNLTDAKHLYLKFRNIVNIKEGAFPTRPHVKYLYLKVRNIVNIKEGLFQNLPNIKCLYLYFNNIGNIEEGTIRNLPKLRDLYLHSHTVNIEEGSFRNLPSLKRLYLHFNNIVYIEEGTFQKLPNLKKLHYYNIMNIEEGTFRNLPNLEPLHLQFNNSLNFEERNLTKVKRIHYNNIVNIEEGNVRNLFNLKHLHYKNIVNIEAGTFRNLPNLKSLHHNNIVNIEEGVFRNLSKLKNFNSTKDNSSMCQLKAVVNYIYNRTVNLEVHCHPNLGKNYSIPKYKNYSLFQPDLQCETCSGMMCNGSEVTNCTGEEPVCQNKLSMNNGELKFERSCSIYRDCVEDMKNNTFTGNTLTNSSTSYVGCCTGNLCNKNNFIGWTHSFVFHLINSIDPSSTPGSPANNASKVLLQMEHELSISKGEVKVEYCGLEENRNIFTIYCTVLSEITKRQVFDEIYNIINTSQKLHNLRIQQNNAELIDEKDCNADTTSTPSGTLSWPMTEVGTTATILCPGSTATRHCSSKMAVHLDPITRQYMASRKCLPLTGIWQEPDMSQYYEITEQLKNIKSQYINKGNIKDFLNKFLSFSQKAVYFKEETIELVVEFSEKMLPLISNVSASTILNTLLLGINNMINTPDKILEEAEQANRCASRMLEIIETVLRTISLEEQQVSVLHSNLGIGVTKVEKDNFTGFVYGVSFGTNETEAKNTVSNFLYTYQQLKDMEMNFISLPKNLLKHLKDEERSTISRISFFIMQDDKLYRIIQKPTKETHTKINSHVVASSVPRIEITNLDEPVTISLNLIDKAATNPQCVYWDEFHWSTKGCSVSDFIPGKKVVCTCDHLTSFAILMDVYQNEGNIKNVQSLSIISNIGCGISFVFLVLTVIIHVCSKNLWQLMSSKILVSLCSSLAVANLIFFIGMHNYIAKIMAACKAVAALLHYFLLTSLMWMTIEALHVCLAVVVVSKTYEISFMMRSSILAWGLPAVIVIINLAINYTNNYIRIQQACWLSKISFYAAFLAPVGILLLFNLTIFSIVIWRLISRQNDKKFGNKQRKIRVFGIIGLFILLGLLWILAFFAFGDAAEIFKFLFAIFNSLQGMFIFIFYCIYMKNTRDVICLYVCKRMKWGQRQVPKNKTNSGNEGETAETIK